MSDVLTVQNSTIQLVKDDITMLDIEAFVFYARNDLELGTGFGAAISVRGGPTIQKTLKELAPLDTTLAVVTPAGELKAEHIVHAVGPKFQEPDIEDKLRATIRNSLKAAQDKGIKALALPPMGAGFYGVPLPTSAEITVSTIKEFLANGATLKEVIICVSDNREMEAMQPLLNA
jgi:O-acetyl-ADP-ribose deacetylase